MFKFKLIDLLDINKINEDLKSGKWSHLVARLLWEHTFLQARLFAINDFYTFISKLIVTLSDNPLLVRVP